MREIVDAELKALGDDLQAMAHRVKHAIESAGQALAAYLAAGDVADTAVAPRRLTKCDRGIGIEPDRDLA